MVFLSKKGYTSNKKDSYRFNSIIYYALRYTDNSMKECDTLRNRIIFTVVILAILVGIGAAYFYFSNMGLIPNSFVAPIGATEGILAILLTAGQWLVPIPQKLDAKSSSLSADIGYIQEIFRKPIYDRLLQGKGAVIVYEEKSNIGKIISLSYRHEEKIVKQIVNGYPVIAAVFPNIEPGTHYIRGLGRFERIELHAGEVRERHWDQDQGKAGSGKEKTIQKRRAVDLRANSLLVGFGGLSLIAQMYFQTPYHLDIVGIFLAGLGIVNLLFSFFLDWLDWRKAGHLRLSVFLIEVGGGIYLAQRYGVIPSHIDILGYPLTITAFFVMGLGGVYLLLTLLFGWFDWYLRGGGVTLFVIGLVTTLIIVFRDVTGPYLRIAGFILLGLVGVLVVFNVIVFIVAKNTGKNFYEWLDDNL